MSAKERLSQWAHSLLPRNKIGSVHGAFSFVLLDVYRGYRKSFLTSFSNAIQKSSPSNRKLGMFQTRRQHQCSRDLPGPIDVAQIKPECEFIQGKSCSAP